MIDRNWKAARIRKKSELDLRQFGVGILNDAIHANFAGLAAHQRGARFHLGGDDVQITLTIHPVHIDIVAIIIEHIGADLHALRVSGFFAGFNDTLRSVQIDGGEVLDFFRIFATHDELGRDRSGQGRCR